MPFHPLKCICGKFIIPQRALVAFHCCFSIIMLYSCRVCFNVAITQMSVKNITNNTNECPISATKQAETKKNMAGALTWSESEKQRVLGAFYYGYFVIHVPSGMLADKFGGRHTLGTSIASTMLLMLLTPFAVHYGIIPSWIIRFLVGCSQGGLYPCVSALISLWAPKHERSTMSGFVFAGTTLGSVGGQALTALFLNYIDWKKAHYIWAFMAFVFLVFFYIHTFSKPETSPWITENELKLIQETVEVKKRRMVPWLKVLRDYYIYILIIGHFGHDWLFYTLQTNLPNFFDKVLHIDITKIGGFSSFPYVFMFISSTVTGIISDYLIKTEKISIVNVRRINTTIGSAVPSVLLIFTCYVGCREYAVAGLMTACLFFKGVWYTGVKTNCVDISKNYAGTVMALVNGFGCISGFMAPEIVGWFTKNNTLKEWANVMWFQFVISTVTNVVYVIFATDKRRKWDFTEEELEESKAEGK